MLSPREARIEAERCLQCFDAPCVAACPTRIPVPTFIAMIRSGNPIGAAEQVKAANPLANICGAVCPQEVFCQSVCTRAKQDGPVRIRELHAHATAAEAARGFSRPAIANGGARVAIVGGGPAGLACGFELARLGHEPHVYEREAIGGVPRASIPGFRLPERALRDDLSFLAAFVQVHHEDVTAERLLALRRGHPAVFLACGLGRDRRLGVSGEELPGVLPVLAFLEQARRDPGALAIGERVVVIGGGNVSLDAAATARRLGAREVTLVYRRSEREMRVWRGELEEARAQGVQVRYLASPAEITGEGRVRSVRCVVMELGPERDASGRAVPIEVAGAEFDLPADTVIVAIGQRIGAGLPDAIARTGAGYVKVDADYRTTLDGVFAGGDAIAGEGTIVQSVAQGQAAAAAIHRFLSTRGAVGEPVSGPEPGATPGATTGGAS